MMNFAVSSLYYGCHGKTKAGSLF